MKEASNKTNLITLRPHHLLCTLSFKGKGYSKEFVDNMIVITDSLFNKDNVKVVITNKEDDICKKCPKKKEDGLCEDFQKVEVFDEKTKEALQLEEKEYSYSMIKDMLKTVMEDNIEDICNNCMWYKTCDCKEIIIEKISNFQ